MKLVLPHPKGDGGYGVEESHAFLITRATKKDSARDTAFP